MAIITKADLFYCEGSSDKVYHIQLEDVGPGKYKVNFQYGRRGSTLNVGTKTNTPVDFATAEKVYNKVLNEKLGKGYKDMSGGGSGSYVAPISIADADALLRSPSPAIPDVGVASPVIFIPQLLNSIDESEAEKFICNDAYGMQEKLDGLHQAVHRNGGVLFTTNKKGKKTGGYAASLDQDAGMKQDFILDAEAIGETYRCFDLLEAYGVTYRAATYQERYEALAQLFKEKVFGGCLKLVPMAIGKSAKKSLYEKLKAEGKEGVVFKRLDSVYVPGKTHDDMWKVKFYSEASCIVAAGREGKMSVGLELIDDKGKRVFMGNVSIQGKNAKIPSVGSVAEIRYLYAHKGGSLYQPFFKELRTDVDVEECLMSQVKYKAEED